MTSTVYNGIIFLHCREVNFQLQNEKILLPENYDTLCLLVIISLILNQTDHDLIEL